RIRSLNQVVTEKRIVWEAPVQHTVQRIDLINSLAGEAAFAIQILIGIGDRPGIHVEPGLARIDGCQPGARRALHTYTYARLQDAISGYDDILLWINDSLIQRMR